MWPRDGSTGTFNYMRTLAADLDIFNDPLWYNPQHSAASSMAVGRTGRDAGTLSDVYEDRNTGRPNDFSYDQRLLLMQRDNWASAQSGISGEFEQLQGGHFYPAELG